jgi:predicted aconitase with swiveling domain
MYGVFMKKACKTAGVFLFGLMFLACVIPSTDTIDKYTVTFNPTGGELAANDKNRQTDKDGRITDLPTPVKAGYDFIEWRTSGNTRISTNYVFFEDTIVFARWSGDSQEMDDGGVAAEIARLKQEAQSGGNYEIVIDNRESVSFFLPPQTLDFGARNNITITIRSQMQFINEVDPNTGEYIDWPCIVNLTQRGSALIIGRGVTLKLEGVTFNGLDRNTAPMVVINSGGALEMYKGARIADNIYETDFYLNNRSEAGGVWVKSGANLLLDGGQIVNNFAYDGGGVKVDDGGYFEMIKGEISYNQADFGGGVRLDKGAEFIMRDGGILNNSAFGGGGVAVWETSTFTMDGGLIQDNSAEGGGGVFVRGLFTMNGGTIRKCSAGDGGGVFIRYDGTFIMYDGEISENEAYGGGGVSIQASPGTFTMFGGVIKDNEATSWGGGVSNDGGYFNMRGGEIMGNKASYQGGGYSGYFGIFQLETGIIYGKNAKPPALPNICDNNRDEDAVYIRKDSGLAFLGIFGPDGTFTSNGPLSGSEDTVKAENGVSVAYGP